MRERANRDRIEVCARGANETKRIAAKRDGTVRYGMGRVTFVEVCRYDGSLALGTWS